MSNLDLVGEMSLEQLENNVETLFGKAKAEELIYYLHSTKIDVSIKNKFYAAIFNNIKSQNSVDSILKNPSTISNIINTVEKQINDLNYSNTTNHQNNVNVQDLQKRINNLLDNKEFLENPLPYIQSLTDAERHFIFENSLRNLTKNEDYVKEVTEAKNDYSKDPTNEYNRKRIQKIYHLKSIEDVEEFHKIATIFDTFSSNKNISDKNILYSEFLKFCKNKNIDIPDKFSTPLHDHIYQTEEVRQEDLKELSELKQQHLNSQNNSKEIDIQDTKDFTTPQSIEKVIDYEFSLAKDPAENQSVFEYGDMDTIFEEVADTNAMQFDFTDQEPIVETPTASSPAEFIQQEMQKQAEEAEKIGEEISEQADLAQDTDKENNYMLEVEEKKGFFSSIKDRFSKFMQKITQKSLPDPNATRAQTTNQSFEAFERKTSIMSTIRSIGDRVTSAVKNISSLNKQNQVPEIKNTATIIGAQKANSQAMEMDNNPTDTNKKSEIIRPKAVQSRPKTNELSSFDKFVKVSNEGNRIEAAAKRDAKGSHNSQDRQQAVVEGSEATSRDDD